MYRDHAATAYASLAVSYDRFTADHNHRAWAATLEALARSHGLADKRLVDIACGTGSSFLPFLERGFSVTGCDLSPEMLTHARRKAGGRARLVRADIRGLPALGPFDLALSTGDVLNYLLEGAELRRACASVASVLAPGGLWLFDVNTLGAYRTVFAADRCLEDDQGRLLWRGHGDAEIAQGCLAEVVVEDVPRSDDWRGTTRSRHIHRHHPDALIQTALAAAALECVAAYGVTPDGRLHAEIRELEHTKRLYVATRSRTEKGGFDASDQEARNAGRPRGRVQQVELAVESTPPTAPAVGGEALGQGPRR